MAKETFLDATETAGRDFVMRAKDGPVTMLNLLRFRETADYSAHPDLAPANPITGREAYKRYMAHTLPFLKESGGEVSMLADAAGFLIGPADEQWDMVLVVRHAGVKPFLAFAQNQDYLAGIGHRTAALADSRLLPMYERKD